MHDNRSLMELPKRRLVRYIKELERTVRKLHGIKREGDEEISFLVPERVGRWERRGTLAYDICSRCGGTVAAGVRYPFCPYCGSQNGGVKR